MTSASSTVLVTGGGGFIGSHLVDRLLRDGHDVRVLDNYATGHRANLAAVLDDIELVEADLFSYERVHDAVRGCEVVFHLGALPSVPRSIQDPRSTTKANVTGTLNVLLASRDEGVRRIVYASSSSVYGVAAELPNREELVPRPIAPYPVSKLAGEDYCRSFTHVYGLETVALRYFNVFGPRQDPFSRYAAVIPRFISAMLKDRRPTIFGDGEESRDFTFVDNVVEATALAAHAKRVAGRVINVACGKQTSLNEIVSELRRLTGKDIEPVYSDPRPGGLRNSLADIARARDALGYEPFIPVREGLRRAVAYYEERLAQPARAGAR